MSSSVRFEEDPEDGPVMQIRFEPGPSMINDLPSDPKESDQFAKFRAYELRKEEEYKAAGKQKRKEEKDAAKALQKAAKAIQEAAKALQESAKAIQEEDPIDDIDWGTGPIVIPPWLLEHIACGEHSKAICASFHARKRKREEEEEAAAEALQKQAPVAGAGKTSEGYKVNDMIAQADASADEKD